MERLGVEDPEAVLIYFPVRGRAEIIRILLSVTKTSECLIAKKDQLTRLKKDGSLLFGQLPLLHTAGMNIVQTGAIVRYLARKGNLLGTNLIESTKIDMLYEGTRDFYAPFMKQGMPGQNQQQFLEELKSTVMAKYLPIFNKVIESNPQGVYLVGHRLSLADVGLIEPLFAILDLFDVGVFDDFYGIKRFLKEIRTRGTIQYYVDNIRKAPNGVPPLDEQFIRQLLSMMN